VLINEEIIRAGAARVYEEFDDIKLAPVLYDAEAVAQRGEAGLWGVCES
jgi:endonuclease YncB( thermonuclease family)